MAKPTKRARIDVPDRIAVHASLKGKEHFTSSRRGKPSNGSVANRRQKVAKSSVRTSLVTSRVEAAPSAPRSLPTSFKIIAGSYEKLLYGLEGTFPEVGTSTRPLPSLKPIFIFPAHVGCVKAVAASPDGGKWLATGSTDEVVKVWNLRRRKEVGGLQQHEGSITYLSFPSPSYLVSASEDGTLCLFRTRGWELLRTLKGHTGRVNCVAVHPSGKVALSVGKDKTLRMWDLMRGKGAASVKLGMEGEVVRWSHDGTRFAVQAQKSIDIYSTDMKPLCSIAHPSRIHDVRFATQVDDTDEVLLVGAEDKKVTVYGLKDKEGEYRVIAELLGHSNRVKSIDTLSIQIPSSDIDTSTTYAVTASSDGFIHMYDLSTLPTASSETSVLPAKLDPIANYDTKGSRLTCVAFAEGEANSESSVIGKRKRKAQDKPVSANGDGHESHESDQDDGDFVGFGDEGLEEGDDFGRAEEKEAEWEDRSVEDSNG